MLKLLSLFSGIGAFEKALENIEEPFEVVRYCEIDKYASKAYSLIHNLDENMNLKDVCSVKPEELPNDIDIITYGFPCQDISNAGKQKGFTNEDGSLTRSGLFFKALDIIEQTKPKIAIAENVKALTGKKFTAEFKIVLDSLNDAGYKNYWAVLNAKDYGIPQNRERVFIIPNRNDIDHGYQFPAKYELKLRLKDLLEETVDEKYFLSDKMLAYFINNNKQKLLGNGFSFNPTEGDGISGTVKPAFGTKMTDTFIKETILLKNQAKDFEKTEISNTLLARDYKGIGNQAINAVIEMKCETERQMTIDDFLPVKEATKKGYKEAHDGDYVNLQYPNSETRRGRVGDQCANTLLCNDANGVVTKDECIQVGDLDRKGYHQFSNRVYSPEGCARTLMGEGGNQSDKTGQYIMPDLRIRKLTPKECFRLMGFDDKDVDILVENKISNTQLYKMAGNSIVVDVLEEIFVELLNQYEDVFPYVAGAGSC